MSDRVFLACCVAGVLLLGGPQLALAQAAKAEPAQSVPSADELLRRVDRQANAFKDATFHFRMRIKEPGGQVREIEFTTLQKGTQKRLVRFLSPGDIKGMGILMESADTMYALLPAFGNRVRRMGTHAKNQSFFGSDLSTEDMAAVEFAPDYSARIAGTEGELTLLELTLRPGRQAEFPRLRMWVDPTRYTVSKIEYLDQAGKKLRTQLRSDFKLDEGSEHYSPGKVVFIDHRRNNHETELILLSSKVNTGLGDDQFTVRALQRN
ncbi:MAG: outer membrane lipoprotein-sorting protein [Myxococcales bacterium]|nr:outer membrane lipoprotein-sorting protein [Myxococcota bacterium]MDW8280368.1 outer membrane lipoprotein-sorting protein [Myxococcales bacterium]